MGCVENVNPPAGRFPKQGDWVNGRVEVCFHYDLSKKVTGTVVRDDREAPGVCLIALDDGPVVLATECQHTMPVHESAHHTPRADTGEGTP